MPERPGTPISTRTWNFSRLERQTGEAVSREPERGEAIAMTAEQKLELQAASFDVTEADAPLREAWRAPAFKQGNDRDRSLDSRLPADPGG